jgi:hypothetical protein
MTNHELRITNYELRTVHPFTLSPLNLATQPIRIQDDDVALSKMDSALSLEVAQAFVDAFAAGPDQAGQLAWGQDQVNVDGRYALTQFTRG